MFGDLIFDARTNNGGNMLSKSCGNCNNCLSLKGMRRKKWFLCEKLDFRTNPDYKYDINTCWKGKKYDRNSQKRRYEI